MSRILLVLILILSLMPVSAQAGASAGSSVTVSISVMLLPRIDVQRSIEECLEARQDRTLDVGADVVCRDEGLVLTREQATDDVIRVIPI